MNPDLKILSQLIAVLKAGLSFHQAEQVAKPEQLSQVSALSYQYLRGLALASGGPPAQAMARVRQVIEHRQEQLRRIELANATPRATVKLVLWLPVAALVIGQFSGLGSVVVLFKSPIALASVLAGGLLLAIGHYWSGRLLLRARAVDFDDAVFLDGIAMAMSGGLPIPKSQELASQSFLQSFAKNPSAEIQQEVVDAIEFSKDTGASLSILLSEKANEIRAAVQYSKAEALEKLTVKLLIPLGASVLPAFALIAVVPIAISFLTNSNER